MGFRVLILGAGFWSRFLVRELTFCLVSLHQRYFRGPETGHIFREARSRIWHLVKAFKNGSSLEGRGGLKGNAFWHLNGKTKQGEGLGGRGGFKGEEIWTRSSKQNQVERLGRQGFKRKACLDLKEETELKRGVG